MEKSFDQLISDLTDELLDLAEALSVSPATLADIRMIRPDDPGASLVMLLLEFASHSQPLPSPIWGHVLATADHPDALGALDNEVTALSKVQALAA